MSLISFSTNNTWLKNETPNWPGLSNCPEGPKEWKCCQEGAQEARKRQTEYGQDDPYLTAPAKQRWSLRLWPIRLCPIGLCPIILCAQAGDREAQKRQTYVTSVTDTANQRWSLCQSDSAQSDSAQLSNLAQPPPIMFIATLIAYVNKPQCISCIYSLLETNNTHTIEL